MTAEQLFVNSEPAEVEQSTSKSYSYSVSTKYSLQKFDRGVSALCWAYNEEDLIEPYLLRLSKLLHETVEDFEIVVVDDCSTDRTNEIVRRIQEQVPEIRMLRNERNLNVGLSCQRAIQAARKEYLFWQTIDWSYDLGRLRTFLELLETFDVVAGVRRTPVKARGLLFRQLEVMLKLFGTEHLTKRSDTVGKAVISVINYALIRTLFRLPISDYQNVCFYPTKLIQSISYESRSSFVNPEGLLKAYWKGASIVEVPISFIPRIAGVAKGTTPKALAHSVGDICRLWVKWIVVGELDRCKPGHVERLNPDDWE
jgi:glycosyltransferase involved in cell wall biosynthesis